MNVSSTGVVQQLINVQAVATQTQQQIAYAVAKQQLDAQRQAGDAVHMLLEQAVAFTRSAADVSGLDVSV